MSRKWQGSKWLNPNTRRRLYERDRHRCVYCDSSIYDDPDLLLTIDHVQPVELGGTNAHSNLVTACRSCNCAKQDRSVAQFIQYLADQGRKTEGLSARVRNAQRRKLPR